VQVFSGLGGPEDQRIRFFLWMPVIFGIGVISYFSIRFEPTRAELWAVAAVTGTLWILARLLPVTARPPVYAVVLIALGFLNASWRAHQVGAPVLGWHYYGPVEGKVVALDRSSSDKPRVTLAEPVLLRVGSERTPKFVRVSLHSEDGILEPVPGSRIMVTARLSPPSGPVEPGGFDFQRLAWFRSLGAVGYARTPAVLAEPADVNSFSLWLFEFRMDISSGIRDRLPDQAGAFAAAILTGDRSAIDPALLEDLRKSNLAHLLAISGLHMGLLTGFIFALVRYGFALIPFVALRFPTKKIAAVLALMAGLAYLGVSGANIATQRAFIMVSVMLVAVLLDRPAITLRAVALAAMIILALRPETVMEPGFQMSFAATSALVATFDYLRRVQWWRTLQFGRFRRLSPVLALIASSAIAGAATAPISAFHFNQIAKLGLLANLLSVPVMGLAVMPSAVVAGLLSLVGLEQLPLQAMQAGIGWILYVAHWIAGLEASVTQVKSAPGQVLALIAAGAIIFMLWHGHLRWVGVVVSLAGFLLWSVTERPDILITDNGRLVGIMAEEGRALTRKRGNGFAADTWLENDGDKADQEMAAARQAFKSDDFILEKGGQRIGYFWGKERPGHKLEPVCAEVDILIAPQWTASLDGPCRFLAAEFLRLEGSVAIVTGEAGAKIITARQATGARLWNSKEVRAASRF
jgi:competence protein ComEC